ncbi:MAG: hypothetical protein J1E35_09705 [Lachnospiraceae bacterium]|nr:hypothetical protein [Lachnospiraceae bacterium]
MEGEDFCGWLIPLEQAEEFEDEWKRDDVSDKWIDNMIWIKWKKDNDTISVEFCE